MQALLLTKYGDPPLVTLGDTADPAAEDGQVLIRVRTAGLNPIDYKLARGFMAAVMDFELPVALGWDVTGTIEALGGGVDRFAVGQQVFGLLGPPSGTAAELVVADAEGPWLAPAPEGLSAATAAAVPMGGSTALTVERTLARTGTVLIIGASGGIGAFLVPMLARAGVTVIATGSGDSVGRLRAAGAETVIDFRADDVVERTSERAPAGVDAVVDLVNQFDGLQASAALLRPGGQLISTLFGPDPDRFERQDVEVSYVRNSPQPGDLERVGTLVADGTVVPAPVHALPFTEAAAAFERLASGRANGKLVLDLTAAGTASPSSSISTTGASA